MTDSPSNWTISEVYTNLVRSYDKNPVSWETFRKEMEHILGVEFPVKPAQGR